MIARYLRKVACSTIVLAASSTTTWACQEQALTEPPEARSGEQTQALWDGVVARVTGDDPNTTITTRNSNVPDGTITALMTEGGYEYKIVENDRDDYRPNIRHAPPGRLLSAGANNPVCAGLGHGNCLLFMGYGSSQLDFIFQDKVSWGNDRLELVLARGSEQGLGGAPSWHFGEKRYLRFYLQIPSAFDSPFPCDTAGRCDEIIISQIWQISNDPILLISLGYNSDSSKIDLIFRYSNDATHASLPNIALARPEFARTTISKGSWYNFHIMMIPRWNDNGSVLIWKNLGLQPSFVDQQAINYSNRLFPWGFQPTVPAGTCDNSGTGDCFDIRVGIYRDVYHDQGHLSRHQPVYIDSLKVTATEAAMTGL